METHSILSELQKLERQSRSTMPFVALGLVVLVASIIYSSYKLAALGRIQAEVESDLKAKTLALSQKDAEIAAKRTELSQLEAQEGALQLKHHQLEANTAAYLASQTEKGDPAQTIQARKTLSATLAPSEGIVILFPAIPSQNDSMTQLQAILTGKHFNVQLRPPLKHPDRHAPEQDEVRYFRAEDRQPATGLLADLRKLAPTRRTVVSYVNDSDIDFPKYFEIHLSARAGSAK